MFQADQACRPMPARSNAHSPLDRRISRRQKMIDIPQVAAGFYVMRKQIALFCSKIQMFNSQILFDASSTRSSSSPQLWTASPKSCPLLFNL